MSCASRWFEARWWQLSPCGWPVARSGPAKPGEKATSSDAVPAKEIGRRRRIERPELGTPATAATVPASKASGGKVMLGSPELTAGIPGDGPLKMNEIEKWLSDPANHETLDIELPLGLAAGISQVQGLDKNPLTRAKIELGRQLYFDPRLSVDVTVSCASCHHPDEGFARHTQFGVGVRGQTGGRNSPVSYNRILSGPQFWDGRAPSLEAQAIGPIANPIEMGNTHEACVECLKGVPGYKLQFDKIFGKLDDRNGRRGAGLVRASDRHRRRRRLTTTSSFARSRSSTPRT